MNSPERQGDGTRELKNEWIKPGGTALSYGGRPVIRPDLGQGHRRREPGTDRRAFKCDQSGLRDGDNERF